LREAALHLIDPFVGGGWALLPGWRAKAAATSLIRHGDRRGGHSLVVVVRRQRQD